MKALKWIAIVVGGLVVAGVLVLAWLGFVPGLSRYLGPEPRDLGVALTVDDAYVAAKAHNMPTTAADLRTILADPEAAKNFDTQLTSDQASSLLALGQDDIPAWPIRFTQINFTGPGTAEASGVVRAGNVQAFLDFIGVSSSDSSTFLSKVPIPTDTTFYVSGACSVSNNVVSLSVSEAQVGRLNVPGSWYQGNEAKGTRYIDSTLVREGFDVQSLTISDGGVHMTGTRPLAALEPWLHIVRSDSGEE